MTDWTIDDAERLYQVGRWGAGYFEIGGNGNLQLTLDPEKPDMRIDIKTVIDEIKSEGIQFPVVVRFHDILRAQVAQLNRTFRQHIKEANYQGKYMGVYPIKVNQMREVVEEIVAAGEEFNYGLEAGSKAELLAVLAMNTNQDSLTILNGYKDEEFMRLALLGRMIGRKVIVVVEKYSELLALVRIAKEVGVDPLIGIRTKMTVVGRGKWAGSGGDRAKFGLSTAEIINACNLLEAEGMIDCLKLLHFHIGSQITDIRSVKEAVSEGGRIYAELRRMGVDLEYVDVGGGLGIDYDGSQSIRDSSRNYSMSEYVADVVYGIAEVCDLENVPHPTLVSESGRAITAHHSCVITQIMGEIRAGSAWLDTDALAGEHVLVRNMRELAESVESADSPQEIYNNASQYKQQGLDAFKLRVVSLLELAKIETLYWQVMSHVNEALKDADFIPEQLQELDFDLSSQYLSNFSVFQSAADSWAIDQVLPVIPLTRMNEQPTINCSIVDITCDSDGKIDQFVGENGITNVIPMHKLRPDEDYYVGIFLTGAYQDVMGEMHNLFGRLNEVHIYSHDDDPEDFYIEEIVRGSSASDVLSIMQYQPPAMAQSVKKMVDKCIANGDIKPRDGTRWTNFYEDCLNGYTYLKTPHKDPS